MVWTSLSSSSDEVTWLGSLLPRPGTFSNYIIRTKFELFNEGRQTNVHTCLAELDFVEVPHCSPLSILQSFSARLISTPLLWLNEWRMREPGILTWSMHGFSWTNLKTLQDIRLHKTLAWQCCNKIVAIWYTYVYMLTFKGFVLFAVGISSSLEIIAPSVSFISGIFPEPADSRVLLRTMICYWNNVKLNHWITEGNCRIRPDPWVIWKCVTFLQLC